MGKQGGHKILLITVGLKKINSLNSMPAYNAAILINCSDCSFCARARRVKKQGRKKQPAICTVSYVLSHE
jgi:hypothetical protein